VDGVQVAEVELVGKVAQVLRALAGCEPAGTSTTLVARTTGIARSSAHRLLESLEVRGLVDRDASTGRWRLGPEVFLLGTACASRYDLRTVAEPVVHRLAVETEESAFLSVRRGDETVCLLGEDGSFPLRSHVLHEGIRLPLGVASAGVAVLAFLPENERLAYLERTDLASVFGPDHSRGAILERVRAARALGYAVNPGLLVEGSWGMAAAIIGPDGVPIAALSLTGVEQRFRDERRPILGSALLRAAHYLSSKSI
jgi:DNA-binding IclR family transcriptional regulator